jgi:hypothetical protein
MIYDGPCFFPSSSQEGDEDEESHDPFEWYYEEAKEMWDEFFQSLVCQKNKLIGLRQPYRNEHKKREPSMTSKK